MTLYCAVLLRAGRHLIKRLKKSILLLEVLHLAVLCCYVLEGILLVVQEVKRCREGGDDLAVAA